MTSLHPKTALTRRNVTWSNDWNVPKRGKENVQRKRREIKRQSWQLTDKTSSGKKQPWRLNGSKWSAIKSGEKLKLRLQG